jgi:hypothetical protein
MAKKFADSRVIIGLLPRPGNISAAMRVEYTASMASPNHDSPAIETEDN